MTNKGKAEELSCKHKCEDCGVRCSNIREAAIEMAEWKDAEFDDETARILFLKICYFLQESECLSQTFDWMETSKKFIKYLNNQ